MMTNDLLDNRDFFEIARGGRMGVVRKAKALADRQREEQAAEVERQKSREERAHDRFLQQWQALRNALHKELDGAETARGTLHVESRDYNDHDTRAYYRYKPARVWCGELRDEVWGYWIDFFVETEDYFFAIMHEKVDSSLNKRVSGKSVEELFEQLPTLLARWM